MPWLIGTAGHVDHGKTTLIKALTGIDADRLPEEQARGLTIDIGFAHIQLPGLGQASIVDVPGHERFLTNMLVGAMGVQVALLCIAADEGVRPQTKEHLSILGLLPVQRLVVAMTRADLADATMLAIATEEAAELVGRTRFSGSPIVAVSAVRGDGLDTLLMELAKAVEDVSQAREGAWYLPIDRVFTVKGHGTVVTGSLMRGQVAAGEVAQLQPGGHKVRVRQIQGHSEGLPSAACGQRTALNLTGEGLDSVERGCLVGATGTVWQSARLELDLQWIEQPKSNTLVRLAIGADDVLGVLTYRHESAGSVTFRPERPVAATKGQPVVILRHSPQAVLGGGTVRIPVARASRRPRSDDGLLQAMGIIGGCPIERLVEVSGQTEAALKPTLQSLADSGEAVMVGHQWLTAEAWDQTVSVLTLALANTHQRLPTKQWVTREEWLGAARLDWPAKSVDRLVSSMAQSGHLNVKGTNVALPGHQPTLPERQERLLAAVEAAMARETVSPPQGTALSLVVNVPPQAIEEITKIGLDTGRLVRIGDGLIYPAHSLQAIVDMARTRLADRAFTASEFKEALGTSRKYAIPLLEHFDSIGIFIRHGDTRRLA